MGDNIPADRILSVSLVVKSLQLSTANGDQVSLLKAPVTIEQSHLVGTVQVVGRSRIPSGSYIASDLVVGSVEVLFIDDFGNIIHQQFLQSSLSHRILAPAIILGKAPSVLRIGLDIPSLVTFRPDQEKMVYGQPIFAISQSFPEQTPGLGGSSDLVGSITGRVTQVGDSSFTVMDVLAGISTQLVTDQNTVFEGLSLPTMNGMLVRVDMTTQADGREVARRVSSRGLGSVVTGVVAGFSGTSEVAAQQVIGRGALRSMTNALITGDLGEGCTFTWDSTGIDLTTTDLSFDAASLVGGQRVQLTGFSALQSDPQGALGRIVAGNVELEQQTLSGTIANPLVDLDGSFHFDLELPPTGTSVLSILGENPSFVHVIARVPAPDLLEGMAVKVHGLLLFNSNSSASSRNDSRAYVIRPPPRSNYTMLARRVTKYR
jgi:Domain of unknown function (DUF5666)